MLYDITLTRGKRDSLIFWPLGAGIDGDDALDNFHYKTKEILAHLETKYDLDLSNPTFMNLKNKKFPHGVPSTGDISDYELVRMIWSDKSHPDAIETDNKEFLNRIIEVADTFPTLINEIDKLKNNPIQKMDAFQLRDIIMNEIDSKLNIFKNQLTNTLSTDISKAVVYQKR